MANAREGSVWYIDTSDTTIPGRVTVCGIKYIGNASGTASIKDTNSSGDLMWEESGTANVFNPVCFTTNNGINITLTNSAKVYIYLDPC